MLTTDLAATSLFLSSVALDARELDNASNGRPNVAVLLSVAIFVAAPPVIHLVHRRIGAALGSFALRAGAPPLLGLLAASMCATPAPDEPDDCAPVMTLGGIVLGALAASAIDVATLSYEAVGSGAAPAQQFGVLPVLSADGKRGELRLVGTF